MPVYQAHFVFQTLIFRRLSYLRYSAPDSNSGVKIRDAWCPKRNAALDPLADPLKGGQRIVMAIRAGNDSFAPKMRSFRPVSRVPKKLPFIWSRFLVTLGLKDWRVLSKYSVKPPFRGKISDPRAGKPSGLGPCHSVNEAAISGDASMTGR